MKVLVLGAGLQGSACAYDLLENPEVERVVLADLAIDDLPDFLAARRGDQRLRPVKLDAQDAEAVLAAMRGMDACLNALPYYFNLEITDLAVEAGVHYADLGGNTDIVFEQLRLDDDAAAKGISVIPDCGLAPGMVNILAADGISELDSPESVRIRVGGLPQQPRPPLNYQVVYSLHGVLDYYTTPSWVLRGGEPRQVDALTEVERVDFPEPVGTLEAFHTAGGISTLPWKYEGKLRSIEYKTLRYPGHAATMRAIRDLGLLETEPVEVGDVEVVPREVFIAAVAPKLKGPPGSDLVALRVEVEGTSDGEKRRIVYDLLDYASEETGISAMERCTGFSLSIIGQMQAGGRITAHGVLTPDEAVDAGEYIHELAKRGVRIEKRTE